MERNLEQVQVPVYEKDFSWLEENLPFFSHLTIGAYQFSFDSEEIIRERPLWPLRSLIRGCTIHQLKSLSPLVSMTLLPQLSLESNEP